MKINLEKNLLLAFIAFSLLTFSSCIDDKGEDVLLINPPTELSFEVQAINSDNATNYSVKTSDIDLRYSGWNRLYGNDESVWLRKGITFSYNLEGEQRRIQVENRVQEYEELLILEGEESYSKRNWDYKVNDVKVENFWKGGHASVIINGLHIETSFLEKKTQIALVDGVEKIYMEIKFAGKAFSFYDPDKEYPFYDVKNGVFKGIID